MKIDLYIGGTMAYFVTGWKQVKEKMISNAHAHLFAVTENGQMYNVFLRNGRLHKSWVSQ